MNSAPLQCYLLLHHHHHQRSEDFSVHFNLNPLWLWLLARHLVQLDMIIGRQIALRWKFTWKSLKLPLSSTHCEVNCTTQKHQQILPKLNFHIPSCSKRKLSDKFSLKFLIFLSTDYRKKNENCLYLQIDYSRSWWLLFPFSLHKCPAQNEPVMFPTLDFSYDRTREHNNISPALR